MFYDRRNCKTERFVALPTREERRGKEVQAKENQSKVQSEKFPAQEQERMKDDHDIVYQSLICSAVPFSPVGHQKKQNPVLAQDLSVCCHSLKSPKDP